MTEDDLRDRYAPIAEHCVLGDTADGVLCGTAAGAIFLMTAELAQRHALRAHQSTIFRGTVETQAVAYTPPGKAEVRRPVRTYRLGEWAIRAVWMPELSMWFTKGQPWQVRDPDAFIRGE